MVWSSDKHIQLRALVLAALEQAGLLPRREEMAQLLDQEGAPLTGQGAVDLGWLWRRLTGALAIEPAAAAAVVARVALYVSRRMQAQMSLPAEAGAAVEAALVELGEGSAMEEALDQAVTEQMRSPMPLPAAQERGGATTLAAQAKPSAPVAPAPEAAPAANPGMQRPARGGSLRQVLLAAGLGIALLGGGALYWFGADQGHETPEGSLQASLFAPVLRVKDARLEDGVLHLAAAEEGFDALSQKDQEATAARIFQLLNSRSVIEVQVTTGSKVYSLVRDTQGQVRSMPVPPGGIKVARDVK